MTKARVPLTAFLASLFGAFAVALFSPACGSESVSSLPDSTNSSATGGSGSSLGTVATAGQSSDAAGGSQAGGSQTTGGAVGSGAAGATSVCTSKKTWSGVTNQSMRPGETCISCHATNSEAPTFVIAGTVYPSLHEPADCNGSNAAGTAIVIITDAQGLDHNITVNSAGNFMLENVAIPLPYHARVQVGTATRSMVASQTSGDCNSCHTEAGTNGAPGRIMLP